MAIMDATTLNTMVGIIGIIVGIIGIVTGIIGGVSLYKANNISVINASKDSHVKSVVYNGMTYSEVQSAIDNKMLQYAPVINSLESLESILKKNEQYSVPIMWRGTQAEFNSIQAEGRVDNGVFYIVME